MRKIGLTFTQRFAKPFSPPDPSAWLALAAIPKVARATFRVEYTMFSYGLKQTVLATALPVAGITAGLAVTIVWSAFLVFELFRAVQSFF
jgi:hypothetical protein